MSTAARQLDEAAPPSRKRERTRRALVQAGRSLISEKGVAGLRISEITDRAGVALGSFYNYFSTKEELVDAVVGEILHTVAEALAARTAEDRDPAEVVSIAIRRFVGIAYRDPDFARLVVHLNHADALFMSEVDPPARRVLEDGVARGRFKIPDLDVAVLAVRGGSFALMRAIVEDRIGPGMEIPFAETCLRSLGIPPAQAAKISRRALPEAEPDELRA